MSRYLWIGLVFCTFAVLWNTETGVACSLGFAAFMILEKWYNDGVFNRKAIVVYVASFLFVCISVLGAIGIVNLYNFMCGVTAPIFRSFFYPYGADGFVATYIRCNPPYGNHAWVYILLLMFGMAASGIVGALYRENDTNHNVAVPVGSISIIGIVCFVYYMNEAHWGGMDIVHQLCFCLMAIILGWYWPLLCNKLPHETISESIKRGMAYLALFVSLTLALNCYNDPVRFTARNYAGAYTFEYFESDIKLLEASIPKNTYGVGQGVSIIYHALEWDDHLKMRDTSALWVDGAGYVYSSAINEILSHDSFLITDSYFDAIILNDVLAIDDSYQKISDYSINGWKYSYYVREP